ncbi:MAG: lysophospholipid acyltransferase family protein [Bacteroidota bacterium]
MGNRVISICYWGFVLGSSIVLYPLAALLRFSTQLFDRRLALLHRFTCFWAALYTWVYPRWRVTFEGREKLYRKRAVVFVANHQSLVDIFVLFRLFVHFKWISKTENFRIPLIGWNMSLNRYIRLDRGSLRGSLGMIRAATAAIREESSVMIFPEGTRSKDGTLQKFQPGAFELALKTGAPLQPIVIDGSAGALPKRSYVLRGTHHIRARILDPIGPELFAGSDAATLKEKIRDLFQAELHSMRRILTPEGRVRSTQRSPSGERQAES